MAVDGGKLCLAAVGDRDLVGAAVGQHECNGAADLAAADDDYVLH